MLVRASSQWIHHHRLLELRLRKSQRLPFKSHEFKELRKFIARLKTQKRMDELKAQGHNPLKRKPKTRRESARPRTKESSTALVDEIL